MSNAALAERGIERLFDRFRLKHLDLPNRFVMPAMQRGWCVDHAPVERMAQYYRRRVEGGVSLIISESCAVAHPSATRQRQACRMDSETGSAWLRCIGAVRDAGGAFLVQLWHEGALRDDEDGQTLSASGIAYPGLSRGRAASASELDDIVSAYAESAWLSQLAGANGIELHCAHGFFLDQFLWPATNRRDDAFGGADIVQRATLATRIIKAIRQACGEDFIVSVRFSQWKEHDYSARIVDAPADLDRLLRALSDAGADMFHASTRRFWEPAWDDSTLSLAGWTRQLSGKPTIAVGSVGLDRDVMQSFLEDGEAVGTMPATIRRLSETLSRDQIDLLAVGRSLIGDPDWVRKLANGDIASIRSFRKGDIADVDWD